MRVSIPAQLRQMIERPINEMCSIADERYRKASRSSVEAERKRGGEGSAPSAEIGVALVSAAIQAGEFEAFKRIAAVLRKVDPSLAKVLGI